MDSWGPGLGHPVAGFGLRVWTLLVVRSDQWLDDFDDWMIRCIEPGGTEAGSLDGDSTACSLEAWGAGSLDADGNDDEGGDEDADE